MKVVQGAAFWLLLKIDSVIYTFIDWIYRIIMILAQRNLLEDSTYIEEMIKRLYIVIGVVILFFAAYSLLRSMVNPDEALKGKESPVKMLTNVIVSIVLIAIIPSVFNFAMDFQNALLKQNTIGKLILGETYTDKNGNTINSAEVISNGGFEMAETIFQAFFHPSYDGEEGGYCTEIASIDNDTCTHLQIDNTDYSTWWTNNVSNPRDFGAIANLSSEVVDGKIDYTMFISTIVGIFVLFVLVIYAYQVAIRLIKLSIFQLIAPLPIIARILPDKNGKQVFSNWIRTTLATYVEVFVRLGILYFAIFIIKIINSNFDGIVNFTKESWGTNSAIIAIIAEVLVIAGIFEFVRQLPGILKDLTGLDSKKYSRDLIGGLGMMTASFGGGVTAAVRSFNADKDKVGMKNRLFRATTAGLGAGVRGGWNGRRVENIRDIPKTAGMTASATLKHRRDMDTYGSGIGKYVGYIADQGKNAKDYVTTWAHGSFEGYDEELRILQNLRAKVAAPEDDAIAFVKKKDYMFSFLNKGTAPEVKSTADEKTFTIDDKTSLSEIKAIIEALKNTGDAEDAKQAASLNNRLEKRFKTVGKDLVKASVGTMTNAAFDNTYMMGKKIATEAAPDITNIKSKFEIAKQAVLENKELETIQKYSQANNTDQLIPDKISDLKDSLDIAASDLSAKITLEQERRKNQRPPKHD